MKREQKEALKNIAAEVALQARKVYRQYQDDGMSLKDLDRLAHWCEVYIREAIEYGLRGDS
jgi:hypothetical protein